MEEQSILQDDQEIFRDDKLNREQSIIALTSLIQNTQDLKVLAINAFWGMGKTTFVKMWHSYLEKQNISSLYFSAWESDYSSEPLVAILGEIEDYIQRNQNLQDKTEDLFSKVIKTGGKFICKGAPGLVRGYLKQKCGEGYDEAVNIVYDEFSSLVKSYPEEKKELEKFKEDIKKLFSQITEGKFVIFIDELDRCRPLYAIELLERIKHLFGTSGVVFVLSIDKKQLGESIKSQYGNIDSAQYLKRFIDLEYKLESPKCEALYEHLYESLRDEREMSAYSSYGFYRKYNLFLIEILAKCLGLTLRELEQCFNQIRIMVSVNKPMYVPERYDDLAIQLAILLVFFKAKDYQDLNKDEKERIEENMMREVGVWCEWHGYVMRSTFLKSIEYVLGYFNSQIDQELENEPKDEVFCSIFESVCRAFEFSEEFQKL